MSTLNPANAAVSHAPRNGESLHFQDAPTRLSRSPRPYHGNRGRLASTNYLPSPASTPYQSDSESRLKFASRSVSPAESGTEADDEALQAKALPPPPLRPRKGLREERGRGYVEQDSDLHTTPPLSIDKPSGRSATSKETKHEDGTINSIQNLREKRSRRRAAELRRRSAEVLSLASISFVVLRSSASSAVVRYRESAFSLIILPILLAVYVLQLLLLPLRSERLFRLGRLTIPAIFDPAPLLYPILIPTLVAFSLASNTFDPVMLNLVLSLSSIPSSLIPFSSQSQIVNPLHWVASLIPAILSSQDHFHGKWDWKQFVLSKPAYDPETLTWLFPLHQTLLPCLFYLTTTSLLPSELQLFSTALINLLFLASSPPILMLKYLVWVFGAGIFILCLKPLEWNVALERIPRWRLRRAGNVIRASQNFLSTLSTGLQAGTADVPANALGSDDEDESHTIEDHSPVSPTSPSKSIDCYSPLESNRTGPGLNLDGNANKSRQHQILAARSGGSTSKGQRKRHKRAFSGSAQHYLSLTPSQANMRKILYTAYTYLATITLLFGPTWYLISRDAMQDHEILGWAMGYLLSEIPTFRRLVNTHNLTNWIPPLDAYRANLSRNSLSHPGPATTRLLLLAYWALTITVGLLSVLLLASQAEVDTRRKLFHGTMVTLLLPTSYIDPPFLSLLLVCVLAAFLLLELLRAAQLPPLSRPLANFLAPYVDGRDLRGPIVVSHIFLLVGCAIPFWLSLAAIEPVFAPRGSPWKGWEVRSRDLSMLAGVICVGLGDAAASLVGRRFGRRKWPWPGGKSLEGSAAFAGAVVAGLIVGKAWLRFGWGGGDENWYITVGKSAVAALGASFTEAVLTGCNDNVVVPVVLWLLVRGLQI